MTVYRRASDIVLDDVFLLLPEFLPDVNVHLKLEGLNTAGSIKLKTAVGLVDDACRAGALRPGCRLIESSSGSLGLALSIVAAERGYDLVVVTDPHANAQSVDAMRALGTTVVTVRKPDANGGYVANRIAYIRGQLSRDPSLIWLNQYANHANADAHRTRTARSIHAELGSVDFLAVGVGSGGTLRGCAEYFQRHCPDTRIVAVDAEGSVTFGGPPAPRHIPGLGASRRPELFVDDDRFLKVVVTERDTIMMCRRIARELGLLVGGSTGTVLAAVDQIADRIAPGSRVVALSPDLGERYLSTIYHPAWVESRYPSAMPSPSGASV